MIHVFHNIHILWRRRLTILFMLLGPALAAGATQSVTLVWDQNPEPDIAGYRLKYGNATGIYGQTVDVGITTTATVAGLDTGSTTFFAVIAYNAAGLEGPLSDEVSFIAGANQAPTVSLAASNNGATLSAPASVNLTASASDADGSVARVEFYNGESKLGEDASSPFSFNWSGITAGVYSLTARAFDNQGTSATSVSIGLVVNGANSVVLLAKSGSPVPGTGASGIPAGAYWTGFGVPAINESGALAYAGKWVSGRSTGGGIFVDNRVIAVAGSATPGVPGTILKSFSDPVIDAAGNVAALATLSGTGVTSVSDQAIIFSPVSGGPLQLIVREGDTAPGTGGARFSSLTGFELNGESIAVQATLTKGTGRPAVTNTTSSGVWVWSGGNLTLAVRRGMNVATATGNKTLATFDCFAPGTNTPGMGRGTYYGDVFGRATFTDGSKAVLTVAVGGEAQQIFQNSAAAGSGGSTFVSYGIPARSAEGSQAFCATTALSNVAGITAANAMGIFLCGSGATTFDPVARLTSGAPGLTGVSFAAFNDAIISADGEDLAFPATLRGTGVTTANNASLWWKPAGQPLTLLARKGTQAPNLPVGAKWKTFTSLAVPGGGYGPLLLGALGTGAGGVTAANDGGLWSANAAGNLALVLREGDVLDGKTVSSFTVIKAVTGCPGVSRSFNDNGQVTALVTFTNGTTAITKIDLP